MNQAAVKGSSIKRIISKILAIGILVIALIGSHQLFTVESALAVEPICPGGINPDSNVIFCDDFEDNTALVRQGRYFEYDNAGGNFVIVDGVGLGGSRGMSGLWKLGDVAAGNIKLAFGRNPNATMNKGVRSTENFREIYYRMYLKMELGWVGNPFKLSRATVITDNNWSQAMIAHIWNGTGNLLSIDPVRCIDANNNVKCIGYNDFAHMEWLGNKNGITPLFETSYTNKWHCIEAHVKLNDPGQSNGIQEFWIDNNLEASNRNLNFVNSYTAYAINAIFFENYWNTGSPKQQKRYFDNIVVSTKQVGCTPTAVSAPNAPTGLTIY